METAIFKPITNSFTIFTQRFDSGLDFHSAISKKKGSKAKLKEPADAHQISSYIRIGFSNCMRMLINNEDFSFE